MNPIDRTTAIPALSKQSGQANVPGLRKLWLIEARHSLGLIDPRTVPNAISTGWIISDQNLQLTEDFQLLKFSFPADRAKYEQKTIISSQGTTYTQLLTLSIPRDHPTTALATQRLANRKWLIIYQDANFQYKLIGTPKQPLIFQSQLQLSPNNSVFTWSGSTPQPAYFLAGESLLIDDGSEFSNGFSYDFFS